MSGADYHIFAVSEQTKLDLMTSDQRRMYAIQKRINQSGYDTQMTRILADAAGERRAIAPLEQRVFVR